ncbi:hypothetical protein MJI20_31440, partial [Salmonella enterica subsp. enterica serovar Anatum]|nr:hypothetical protein [Salmonella enterica subsp. enterica serovar Anatum]
MVPSLTPVAGYSGTDSESYQEIFAQPHATDENDTLLSDTQPRLQFALEQLIQPWAS